MSRQAGYELSMLLAVIAARCILMPRSMMGAAPDKKEMSVADAFGN